MAKASSGGRFWAMMCHFSTWLGFVIPGFSVIAPLMIWGLKRDEDSLIQKNGRNVINFILSFWLYSLGLFVASLFFIILFLHQLLFASSFLDFVVWFYVGCMVIYGILYIILHLALPLYGGLKAFNGEVYRYPLTISFLKESGTNLQKNKSSAK